MEEYTSSRPSIVRDNSFSGNKAYIDPQNHLIEDNSFIDAISNLVSGGGNEDNDSSDRSNSRSVQDLFSSLRGGGSLEGRIEDTLGNSINQGEASVLQQLIRGGLDILPDSIRSRIINVGSDIMLNSASEEKLEQMIIDYAQGLSPEDLVRIATTHVSEIGHDEIHDMMRDFVVSMDKDELVDMIQSAIDSGMISDDELLDIGLDSI